MPGNLESSVLDTEQEKVSLNSDPKERLCQRMFKLPHNCMHLTRKQNDAQSSPRQASTVHQPRISDVKAGFRKVSGTRDQIANIPWMREKAREFKKNIYI